MEKMQHTNPVMHQPVDRRLGGESGDYGLLPLAEPAAYPYRQYQQYQIPVSYPENRLLKLWEIPANLRCPIAGTCLDDEEIRRIFKKTGYKLKKVHSFKLHAQLMDVLRTENRISVRTDRYLRRKYRDSIKAFANLDENSFMQLWQDRLKTGDFEDMFYISSLRPDFSDASSIEIYGEIHMMGHARTKEVMKARQCAVSEIHRNLETEEQLLQEKERNRSLKKEYAGIKAELEEACKRITQLSHTCTCLRKSCPPNREDTVIQKAEEKNCVPESENRKMAKEIRRIEREKRKLQIELFELRSSHQQLAEETKELIARFGRLSECSSSKCNRSCPDYPTCPKRVLIVGGITRIRHLYRELVESGGGEFDYHDGYMKNGRQNIEARIRRSDIVICPVNCNSHGACERVKRICKKYDKTVKMLPSSSLSAISEVLYGISAN